MLNRFCPKIVLLAVGCVASALSPAAASDDLSETALAIAPKDVAFFSTSVNMSDSWQDLAESRLVTRLRSVPYVQKLEAELMEQWNNPPAQAAQAKAVYESPMAQNVLKFFGEMFSDEVFVYGQSDWNDAMHGFVDFNNSMSYAMSRGPDAMEDFFEQQLPVELAKLHLPSVVMGFRIEDKQNALFQLNALEAITRMGGSQIPELGPVLERLKHSDLEDGTALSISLDASLIPLEQLDDEQRDMAEKVIEALSGRGITIGLAVRDGLFLVAISEADDVLASVGQTSETLISHQALDVLKEAAPSRLRAVSFVAAEFRQAAWSANMENYFSRMTSQLTGIVRNELEGEPGAEEWIGEIETDAKNLDAMIAQVAPTFGPQLAWQFATDTGAEGRNYDWTDSSALENASPLNIVNHSGSRPLLSISFKQAPDSPQATAMAEYLIEAAERHAKRFVAMAERSDEEKEQVLSILDRSMQLVGEMVDVLQSKVAPSLAERQSVFSVAGQMTINNIGGQTLPQAVPVPEMALACKVVNQELFLSGCADLLTVFDGVVELIREVNPQGIPSGYAVPRPQEETIQGGRRFFYSEFADAIPVEGINPQIAINNDVVVFGYSQRQVDDMLKGRQTNVRPAWVAPNDEVAAVSVLDIAGITKMIRPWAAMGMQANLPSLDTPVAPGDGPIPTGNDILDVWDCLTSLGKVVGSTEANDEAVVTRWVWIEQ